MIGFIMAAIFVNITLSLVWLMLKVVDGSVLAGAAAIGLAIVVLGVAINIGIKESDKGPCHQWETRMMYNAATKTMMPSRVCVLRGEWVTDENGDEK